MLPDNWRGLNRAACRLPGCLPWQLKYSGIHSIGIGVKSRRTTRHVTLFEWFVQNLCNAITPAHRPALYIVHSSEISVGEEGGEERKEEK